MIHCASMQKLKRKLTLNQDTIRIIRDLGNIAGGAKPVWTPHCSESCETLRGPECEGPGPR